MAYQNILKSVVSILHRKFHTTTVYNSKKNVRKFPLFAFRWTRDFKERQKVQPDPDIPVYAYGVREPLYNASGNATFTPEMVPELIVPDLTDCKLKPYVSYKVPDIIQSEFTAQDLFDAVYSRKIEDDYIANKLDADGKAIEPSESENLTPEEAKMRARRTGCDMFFDNTFQNSVKQ